jgi:hypothetical protein
MNLSHEKKKRLLTQLEKITDELKRLGIWEMTEAQMEGSFLGQLRYGMIPGIQARLAGELPLPEESNLGVFAVREFDGQSAMEPLKNLLCEFDSIYEDSD